MVVLGSVMLSADGNSTAAFRLEGRLIFEPAKFGRRVTLDVAFNAHLLARIDGDVCQWFDNVEKVY
jgi:hypothetical protein